ncbi:MAG TPA: SCP2 sterol-binding domain-containing protein [Halococcus sp.]|nr:SCP2 sterol-binding domain-containing protein [Halococcus sp.]
MSAQNYTIEDYFPTEPWLEKYREGIEASEEVSNTGEGWGVDWQGEMIFHIKNLPLSEHVVADMPDEIVSLIDEAFDSYSDEELEEIVAAAPDEVRSDIEARDGDLRENAYDELMETRLADGPERMWPELREASPELLVELLEQIEENITDGETVYSWIDLYDGTCREVAVLQSPDEREHGFVLSGDYETWKDLVEGEADVISLIMSGDMELDGDMQKMLQYSDAAVALTEVAAAAESRFLF